MKDEFSPIKMDTWPMAESFYYYSQMSPASYSLTVEIDVTKLRKHLKSKDLKFFPTYLYILYLKF